ncbi:hypothetical protein I302_103274 [Kwoniella bestiolae CBS 10118]|uniref:Uncharacterized protein n=1 Tax=Kwoniella bestiolae CBS 10118 TaxID=1296100 RepID=A0A1B9G7Z0_9TREE|nr:hypothetical protein I302_01973 [Kwoniella bestiolae CBS 10118]OCF27138.1 hypothetical protein I302_01973 [Kwoniella bestiolae CBS 10118]
MLATSPRAISPVGANPHPPNNPNPNSKSISYRRSFLLSLANPTPTDPQHRPRKISRPLSSFTPILRCSIALSDSDWGISEESSSLFDNQPISRDLPIPREGDVRHPCDRSTISRTSGGSMDEYTFGGSTRDSETLFHYKSYDESLGGENKLPILVDFGNPFAGGGSISSSPGSVDKAAPTKNKDREPQDKHPLSTFPRSVNSSTTSLQDLGIRLGPRENLVDPLPLHLGGRVSRSNSNSSSTSLSSIRRSSSFSRETKELNPFAPPFPLPNTQGTGTDQLHQPKPISLKGTLNRRISISNDRSNSNSPEIEPFPGSLPLPKNLPPSLPPKPSSLAPVFVKRESAALPQPMALPDIPPLGREWTGENSLSGNEKRRRASLLNVNSVGNGHNISRGSSPLGRALGNGTNSAPGSRRGSFASASGDDVTIIARAGAMSPFGERLRRDLGSGRRGSESRDNKERW